MSITTTPWSPPSCVARRRYSSATRTRSKALSRMVSLQARGMTSTESTQSASIAPPAITGRCGCTRFLSIVLPRDLRELRRIAEHAIQSTVDRAGVFQRTERCIDLGATRSEELGELGLREAELQRYAFSRRRATAPERQEQKPGKPDFERVKRNRFQLTARFPQPAT